MNVLDLFSGIGGFSLGLERAGMRTVAFCEIEPFCRSVLRKHWPDVPIFEDIRTLTRDDIAEPVDVVCGGYPCQPFSLAGKRAGAADDRHLWPEMRRVVDEFRPTWVIGENVAGHIGMGLDDVLSDLEALGYACRAFVIPAVAVDAPHRRDRVWIVAHAERAGVRNIDRETGGQDRRRPEIGPADVRQGHGAECAVRVDATGQDVADAPQQFSDGGNDNIGSRPRPISESGDCIEKSGPVGCWWLPESDVGLLADGLSAGLARWCSEPEEVPRVATGVPERVNKLKALGNSVVPQIPEIIGRAIMKVEEL